MTRREVLSNLRAHLYEERGDRARSGWLVRLPGQALAVILALLGLLYAFLFLRFRAYEIDNPWYLSFSRNHWVDGVEGDTFLNGIFPDGMGGTVMFGRGPALVQGAVLSHFGWSPVPAMLLSTLIVLAGLGVWYRFLRKLGLSKEQGLMCVLGLGLTEPFVDMAVRFRFEPYGFLLMGLAFWLASEKRPWLGLTIGLLALETEPVGGIVFASVMFYQIRSGYGWRRVVAGCGVAVLCFGAVYGLLHPDFFGVLRGTDWHRGEAQRSLGGFLRAYFVNRKRHLGELGLLGLCGAVFARRWREAPAPVMRMAEVVGLASVCSFAMNWPTPAYMVFWYPAALVVASWCVAVRGWSQWVMPGAIAMLMLPQYGALAWINRHDGFGAEEIRTVAAAIGESERTAGLEDRTARIMGDYTLWFAHPARYKALANPTLGAMGESDLFLCFDGPLLPPAMVDPIVRYCGTVERAEAVREVNRVMVRGHVLRMLVPKR